MVHPTLRHAVPLMLALSLCCAAGAAADVPRDGAAVKAVALTAAQFKPFEGEYALAPGFSIAFFQQDGKLMSQATGQAAFEIFADSPDTFFATVAPIKISFTKDASGHVTHMNLVQGGRTLPPAPRTK